MKTKKTKVAVVILETEIIPQMIHHQIKKRLSSNKIIINSSSSSNHRFMNRGIIILMQVGYRVATPVARL